MRWGIGSVVVLVLFLGETLVRFSFGFVFRYTF